MPSAIEYVAVKAPCIGSNIDMVVDPALDRDYAKKHRRMLTNRNCIMALPTRPYPMLVNAELMCACIIVNIVRAIAVIVTTKIVIVISIHHNTSSYIAIWIA